MRVYLDGKIKGMPNKNKELFDKYEDKLIKIGHQVFNAQRYAVNNEHRDYDEVKVELLLESQKCDAICLINGWNASDRVREYVITWLNNKKKRVLYNVNTMEEIPRFKKVDIIYRVEDGKE